MSVNIAADPSQILQLQSLSLATQQVSVWCWCAGIVTSVVTPEELGQLEGMAAELGVDLEQQPEPAVSVQPLSVDELDTADPRLLDSAKQGLEDLFNMY